MHFVGGPPGLGDLVTDGHMSLAATGPERLREAALGAFAALLAVVFALLLAADQGRAVAGVL